MTEMKTELKKQKESYEVISWRHLECDGFQARPDPEMQMALAKLQLLLHALHKLFVVAQPLIPQA